MATPRDIRRLALQALFQLDTRDGDAEAVNESTALGAAETKTNYTDADIENACDLAAAAYGAREVADAAVCALAPTWPASRQPAIDRAILRLAHYEMTTGLTPPKSAVNEAIELAKVFSTDRSPAFINGVLDKILKSILHNQSAQTQSSPAEDD